MDSWGPSDIPVVERLAPKEPERFAAKDLRPFTPPLDEPPDAA